MQGVVLFSDDGRVVVMLVPPLDGQDSVLVYVCFDGVDLPLIPIPLGILRVVLGVENAKT